MGAKLRNRPKARRNRRSGQSPYQRHAKAPYLYSSAYKDWHARTRMGAKRNEAR